MWKTARTFPWKAFWHTWGSNFRVLFVKTFYPLHYVLPSHQTPEMIGLLWRRWKQHERNVKKVEGVRISWRGTLQVSAAQLLSQSNNCALCFSASRLNAHTRVQPHSHEANSHLVSHSHCTPHVCTLQSHNMLPCLRHATPYGSFYHSSHRFILRKTHATVIAKECNSWLIDAGVNLLKLTYQYFTRLLYNSH